jgi:mannose-6-phosphate isomerase-like protein (cupin superfamily)
MDDVTTIERKPNVATDKAVLFSMRNLPLLQQGTTYDPLATAENLWVNIKVYASGGENALHSHGGEDHAFIVLQGKATFTFGDGRTSVVGQYEGVMIPKNGLYKFVADQAENLVMLRVGGGVRTATGLNDLTPFGTPKDVVQKTSFADGEVKVGDAVKNGETAKVRIYARGKCFAPD